MSWRQFITFFGGAAAWAARGAGEAGDGASDRVSRH
jgi:hypothetical protein